MSDETLYNLITLISMVALIILVFWLLWRNSTRGDTSRANLADLEREVRTFKKKHAEAYEAYPHKHRYVVKAYYDPWGSKMVYVFECNGCQDTVLRSKITFWRPK